jgi:hypothetical protein
MVLMNPAISFTLRRPGKVMSLTPCNRMTTSGEAFANAAIAIHVAAPLRGLAAWAVLHLRDILPVAAGVSRDCALLLASTVATHVLETAAADRIQPDLLTG